MNNLAYMQASLVLFCFIIILPYTQKIHIKFLKKMRRGSPMKLMLSNY